MTKTMEVMPVIVKVMQLLYQSLQLVKESSACTCALISVLVFIGLH